MYILWQIVTIVCRLVDWDFERVCKREQKQLVAHSRMLKYNRRILMRNPDALTENERELLMPLYYPIPTVYRRL